MSKQTIRKLTSEDIPACRILWQARFGDSDAFCDWYFSDRFCPDLSIGLFEDDRLCSMAHGRLMYVRDENGTIANALMIGGVSTALDCEGRGLMKRVMAEMESIGQALNVDLLILGTETPALYRSSGFEVCAKALYTLTTGENEQPLNFDRASYNIHALIDCCSAAFGKTPFFPIRTKESMQSRVDELCCEGGGLLMLRNENGTLAGYAFCDPVSGRADEVIACTEADFRKILAMLPKGAVAMLPPHLKIEGERNAGAWLMCKPLKIEYAPKIGVWQTDTAFCPETF